MYIEVFRYLPITFFSFFNKNNKQSNKTSIRDSTIAALNLWFSCDKCQITKILCTFGLAYTASFFGAIIPQITGSRITKFGYQYDAYLFCNEKKNC